MANEAIKTVETSNNSFLDDLKSRGQGAVGLAGLDPLQQRLVNKAMLEVKVALKSDPSASDDETQAKITKALGMAGLNEGAKATVAALTLEKIQGTQQTPNVAQGFNQKSSAGTDIMALQAVQEELRRKAAELQAQENARRAAELEVRSREQAAQAPAPAPAVAAVSPAVQKPELPNAIFYGDQSKQNGFLVVAVGDKDGFDQTDMMAGKGGKDPDGYRLFSFEEGKLVSEFDVTDVDFYRSSVVLTFGDDVHKDIGELDIRRSTDGETRVEPIAGADAEEDMAIKRKLGYALVYNNFRAGEAPSEIVAQLENHNVEGYQLKTQQEPQSAKPAIDPAPQELKAAPEASHDGVSAEQAAALEQAKAFIDTKKAEITTLVGGMGPQIAAEAKTALSNIENFAPDRLDTYMHDAASRAGILLDKKGDLEALKMVVESGAVSDLAKTLVGDPMNKAASPQYIADQLAKMNESPNKNMQSIVEKAVAQTFEKTEQGVMREPSAQEIITAASKATDEFKNSVDLMRAKQLGDVETIKALRESNPEAYKDFCEKTTLPTPAQAIGCAAHYDAPKF